MFCCPIKTISYTFAGTRGAWSSPICKFNISPRKESSLFLWVASSRKPSQPIDCGSSVINPIPMEDSRIKVPSTQFSKTHNYKVMGPNQSYEVVLRKIEFYLGENRHSNLSGISLLY